MSYSWIKLISDKWEFHHEIQPDWDYIIENKCLCWFWNNSKEKFHNVGFLKSVNNNRFLSFNSFEYSHCQPVCKDKVTFYEDKKL